MRLTTSHINKNNNYIKEGLYLSRDDINILMENNINTQYTLDYIYEQNYVNSDNVLTAISIGLVIENNDDEDSEEAYIEALEEDIKLINDYLRSEKEISTQIIYGIYEESSNTSYIAGNYIFEATSNDLEISDLKSINEKYYILNTTTYSNYDSSNDDIFDNVKESIIEFDQNAYVAGKTFYIDEQLVNAEVDVTLIYPSYSDVNALATIISNELDGQLENIVKVRITIKNNDDILAILSKESGTDKYNLTIFD